MSLGSLLDPALQLSIVYDAMGSTLNIRADGNLCGYP